MSPIPSTEGANVTASNVTSRVASEGAKLLEVSGLTMDFGGLRAVDNVGLDILRTRSSP